LKSADRNDPLSKGLSSAVTASLTMNPTNYIHFCMGNGNEKALQQDTQRVGLDGPKMQQVYGTVMNMDLAE
jgi:hypothetical protein